MDIFEHAESGGFHRVGQSSVAMIHEGPGLRLSLPKFPALTLGYPDSVLKCNEQNLADYKNSHLFVRVVCAPSLTPASKGSARATPPKGII